MPLVKDLIFKDAYVDAARTKILSDGSMNYVVEMYDTALKETISKLKQADKLVRVKDTVLNRRTGDHAIERSNEPTERDLEGSSVQGRGNVSGIERTEDASEPTTASVALSPAPVAVNLVVREEPSTPTLGVSYEHSTLPLGEDGTGLDPEDLVELSDSSAEEDGGDKSNEQVPASNPQGAEEDLEESSAKEQDNVDGVENPPDSTTDGTGGASDPLGAQVIGGDLDRAED
ncbi:hypothetical protein DY000_02059022 [Brassica cretica]|uniref:WPP domain-containing protein n=1 Tax=Brassica cretica TaxID=69181 RepID=A0ABQ7B3W8_BRACR|nr:hypothetical protein DY000_02059022 [Brassica cretica]